MITLSNHFYLFISLNSGLGSFVCFPDLIQLLFHEGCKLIKLEMNVLVEVID